MLLFLKLKTIMAMKKPKHSDSESGAVLALVAAIVFVLVLMLCFVVDINLQASSKEQTLYYERFAALAAIEAYHSASMCDEAGTPVPATTEGAVVCTACQRYEFALKRTNELLEGNRALASKDKIPLLIKPEGLACSAGGYTGDSKTASLVPGVLSDDADECGSKPLPCFLPVENITTHNPNAFRIAGEYYQGVSGWLTHSMFGQEDYGLQAQAVSTLVPRRGCFVVDISASSIRNTHKTWAVDKNQFATWVPSGNSSSPFPGSTVADPDPNIPSLDYGWGNEFSYYLNCSASNLRCNRAWNNPSGSLPLYWTKHDFSWYLMNTYYNAADTTAETDKLDSPIHHFANEYIAKKIYGDSAYAALPEATRKHHPDPAVSTQFTVGSADEYWAQIDVGFLTRTGSGNDYRGPEPLRSIFMGLRSALNQFKSRRVSGDMACLIFYDRNLTWTRTFLLTNEFDYLLKSLEIDDRDNNGTLRHDRTHWATGDTNTTSTTATAPTGFEKIIRHNLFPGSINTSYTNTLRAIQEALNQLRSARSGREAMPTADFIVAIGDGLQNCQSCEATCTNCYDSPLNKTAGGACKVNSCENTFANYQQARADLYGFINEAWADPDNRNIPIHVLLLGDYVAPHSIDLINPDKPEIDGEPQCLSPKQIRQSGYKPVRGSTGIGSNYDSWHNHFKNATKETPFKQANADWYNVALFTRGLWAPIRSSSETCVPAHLDKKGNPCEPAKYGIDASEERLEDPWCRTEADQIKAYMDDILGDSPFTLIEP